MKFDILAPRVASFSLVFNVVDSSVVKVHCQGSLK